MMNTNELKYEFEKIQHKSLDEDFLIFEDEDADFLIFDDQNYELNYIRY